MKKLKSRVCLKVKGLNQERAFSTLAKKVKILKVDREDKHICKVEIAPWHAKEAKKFLQSQNFEILEEKESGLSKLLKALSRSYGVLVALVLCFCGYLAQKNIIWQIKVYGNDKLSSHEITSFLNENITSRWNSSIDTKKLEILVKENFNRVSSVSIALVGQSMVVNIHETLLPDEMVAEFSPVVSAYNGKITSINLIQGTLKVKQGQVVKAGDILVEPYIIDSQGQKRSVKAMAEIKADVWLVGKGEHHEQEYQTFRTGKVMKMQTISLFGIELYKKGNEVDFSQYDKEVKTSDFNHNLLLPFKITTTTYYETETKLVESSFEDKKDEITDLAHQKALQFLQDYEIIKEESVSTISAGGVSIVTYVLTVEREIGETK